MAELMHEPAVRVWDNPILVGMTRMRLRNQQLSSAVLKTLALCGFATLGAAVSGEAGAWDGLCYMLLVAMGALLCLRAPGAVCAQLSEERQTGILEFHRAAPMTPWSHAVGYMLGASSRDWLGAAVMLPFFLLSAVMAPHGGLALVAVLPFLMLSALVYQAAGLVLGLMGNPRRAGARSGTALVMVLWFVATSLHGAGLQAPLHLTPFAAAAFLSGAEPRIAADVTFFGAAVPALAFTLVMHLHALAFLLMAAYRRLRREDAPLLSRRQALAFVATVNVLMLGGAWSGLSSEEGRLVGARSMAALVVGIYMLTSTVLASFTAMALAPPFLTVSRTLRRAVRQGSTEVGWLEDGGPLLGFVAALGGLLLAGMVVVLGGSQSVRTLGDLLGGPTWMAMVSSVALLGAAAGAAEHAQLTWRKSAWTGVTLWAFGVVVVPLLAAGVMVAGESGAVPVSYMASLSPVFAVGALLMGHALWAESDVALMGPMLVSMAVTMGLAAMFHLRIRRTRAELAASMKRPVDSGGPLPR